MSAEPDLPKEAAKPAGYNEITLTILGASGLENARASPFVKVKDAKGLVGSSDKDVRTECATDAVDPVWEKKVSYQFDHKLSALKFKVMASGEGFFAKFLAGEEAIAKGKLPIDDLLAKAVTGVIWSQGPVEIDAHLPLKDISDGKSDCVFGCASPRQRVTGAKLHIKATCTFHCPIALPGVHIKLPEKFQIGLSWEFKKRGRPIDLDASIFGLDSEDQIVDKSWKKKLHAFGGGITQSINDRKGEGSGDDETITIDASLIPAGVDKLPLCINSFQGQSLSSVKYMYVRIIVDGQTHAFFALGEGNVPDCTGLFFGVVQRVASPLSWLGHASQDWEFVTTAVPASGINVEASRPAILAFGKKSLGW